MQRRISTSPNRWFILLALIASARCDCNDHGAAYIHAEDVPLALSFWSCGLLRCCEHHLTDDECFANAHSGAETWVARAKDLGLHYQRGCAEKLYLGDTECSTLEQRQRYYWACDEACAVYHGSAALGEPCELVGRHMSTCAEHLVCGADERCHAPCDAPELALAGQRCGAALGLDCAAGLA